MSFDLFPDTHKKTGLDKASEELLAAAVKEALQGFGERSSEVFASFPIDPERLQTLQTYFESEFVLGFFAGLNFANNRHTKVIESVTKYFDALDEARQNTE